MWRNAVCAAVVLVFSFGTARSAEFFGAIKKIEDDKIVVGLKYDKETKKFAEEKTLPLAKDVKILTGKFKKEDDKVTVEAGDPLEGGFKNERFKTIDERPVRAYIITNADNQVTEIRVLMRKKPE
jgi:hypothetical protein